MRYIKNGEIDIRKLVIEQVKHWYIYAGAVVLCLLAAFLYNRYTIEQYEVLAAVRVEQSSSQSIDPTKILFGGETSPFRNDVEDEVFIIKSYPIVSQAVRHLNLGVNYYRLTEQLGRFIEMHNDMPFFVEVSENLLTEGYAGEFEVEFSEDGSTFQLSIDGQNVNLDWGKSFQLGGGSVQILRNDSVSLGEFHEFTWVFTIPGTKAATYNYIDRLNVSPKAEDSRVLFFLLTGGNADKERNMLDALLHFYIKDDLRVKNQVAANTIDFIESELQEIRDSLNKIETRLELFKSSKKISDLSSEASKVFDQLVTLEEEKAVLRLKDKYYEYLFDYMDSPESSDLLVSPESFGVDDANLNQLVLDIIQAQLQINSLEERGNVQNPIYNEMKVRIEQLHKVLNSSLSNARAANQLKLQEVDRRLSYIESSMRSFPGSEIQLINIQRLYKISENLYLLLMEKKAEAEISLSSSTSDIRIVEPARMASPMPISPNKKLVYLIALFGGLVFAFSFLLVRDYLDDKIQGKEDILERADIPFAGEVVTAKSTELSYLKENPKSQLAECFRTVRFNFNYMIGEVETPVILVTSTIPGEGKTFFSSRLAYSISGPEKKGIIIGADLRKPKLHSEFELDNNEGLSSYLVGRADLDQIIQVYNDHLDVLPSGPVPPNPLELFEKPKFRELIAELKRRYYFIVIDTPPIGLVSESAEIMKVVDLSVFVLRAGYSPLVTIDRILETTTKMEDKPFAFVINDVEQTSGYGYYGKYGYYSE